MEFNQDSSAGMKNYNLPEEVVESAKTPSPAVCK